MRIGLNKWRKINGYLICICGLIITLGVFINILVGAIGLAILIAGFIEIKRYKSNFLLITSKKIEEQTNNETYQYQEFEKIVKLDCEIYKTARSISVWPVFFLQLKDGSTIRYKTQEEYSLSSCVDWVEKHNPQVSISISVVEFLKKHKFW